MGARARKAERTASAAVGTESATKPQAATRSTVESTSAKPASGPLLDWWYVHAGYVSFDSGTAELWDAPQGIEIAVQPAEKSEPILVADRPWEDRGDWIRKHLVQGSQISNAIL